MKTVFKIISRISWFFLIAAFVLFLLNIVVGQFSDGGSGGSRTETFPGLEDGASER